MECFYFVKGVCFGKDFGGVEKFLFDLGRRYVMREMYLWSVSFVLGRDGSWGEGSGGAEIFSFGKRCRLRERRLWSEESFLCFGKRYILCKDSSGVEDFFCFRGDTCWVEVLVDRLFFLF